MDIGADKNLALRKQYFKNCGHNKLEAAQE